MYKQAIILRTDLKMSKGKLVAQGSHAAVDAAFKSSQKNLNIWFSEGMKKVALRVDSLKELLDVQKRAKVSKLVASLIKDAGHTELAPGTMTALGIGPAEESKIDKITGQLKAL